jgi:hypothetical protein
MILSGPAHINTSRNKVNLLCQDFVRVVLLQNKAPSRDPGSVFVCMKQTPSTLLTALF